MERSSEAAARVQQIEAQQDEILWQLEQLERRTEAVLAEHAPPAVPRPGVDAIGDPAGAPAPSPLPEAG